MVGAREKQAWAMLVIAVGGLATYGVLLLAARDGQPADEIDYQRLMLGTILAAIVVGFVTAVVFSVQAHRAGESDRPDARDREVDRFGRGVGQALIIVGGMSALLMALAEWPWFWIANTLYLGFTLGAILEGSAKVIAYRRGLPW